MLPLDAFDGLAAKWPGLRKVIEEQLEKLAETERHVCLNQARQRWSEMIARAHRTAMVAKALTNAEIEQKLRKSSTGIARPLSMETLAIIEHVKKTSGDGERVNPLDVIQTRREQQKEKILWVPGDDVIVTRKGPDFGRHARVVEVEKSERGQVRVVLGTTPLKESERLAGVGNQMPSGELHQFLSSELRRFDEWSDWNLRRKHGHDDNSGSSTSLRRWRVGDRVRVTKKGSQFGHVVVVSKADWQGRVQVVDDNNEVRIYRCYHVSWCPLPRTPLMFACLCAKGEKLQAHRRAHFAGRPHVAKARRLARGEARRMPRFARQRVSAKAPAAKYSAVCGR